jgi:hypothetical protein
VLIGAKKAQDMVVWLLAFQKSLCLINEIHCCVTSLIVKFSTGVVLAITQKIDVESHNQPSI